VNELARIRASYSVREQGGRSNDYSILRNDSRLALEYLDRAILRALVRAGLTDFAKLRLLEVGCGSGGNLLRFLRWGFSPSGLVGNELLRVRCEAARAVLPSGVHLIEGDARDIPDDEFDIVLQSTVFSSILDKDFQMQVADRMWSLVKPGGVVLSYDLAFDNPRNPDVARVSRRRITNLFPTGECKFWKVTLAPPIARRVAFIDPAYRLANALPMLRTHTLSLIRKPSGESG
jgi:SAM-dependent methyltransferase